MDINVQNENIEKAFSNPLDPSEQRLENALNSIESFFVEQENQSSKQSYLQNKEVVVANLDILISRVQDILVQFNAVK